MNLEDKWDVNPPPHQLEEAFHPNFAPDLSLYFFVAGAKFESWGSAGFRLCLQLPRSHFEGFHFWSSHFRAAYLGVAQN